MLWCAKASVLTSMDWTTLDMVLVSGVLPSLI